MTQTTPGIKLEFGGVLMVGEMTVNDPTVPLIAYRIDAGRCDGTVIGLSPYNVRQFVDLVERRQDNDIPLDRNGGIIKLRTLQSLPVMRLSRPGDSPAEKVVLILTQRELKSLTQQLVERLPEE